MIVELNKICKNYSRGKEPVPVLFDIDLEMRRGDYIAIMGPSGSGKTTLMNIIGFLDNPTSGTYRLAGKDYGSGSDDQLATIRNRNIGFVFQNFYLLPKLDALDNVALPLLYADVPLKERRERAKAALEKVGLGERIHFFPNQLSGGQCQRVAIARAIVGNPELLLADEPTGALDTASGRQVMEIFRELNEAGVSIIVITHEQSVADCSNRIYRILDGRIVSVEQGLGHLPVDFPEFPESMPDEFIDVPFGEEELENAIYPSDYQTDDDPLALPVSDGTVAETASPDAADSSEWDDLSGEEATDNE